LRRFSANSSPLRDFRVYPRSRDFGCHNCAGNDFTGSPMSHPVEKEVAEVVGLEKERVMLQWELLFQTAQSYRRVGDLIKMKRDVACGWSRERTQHLGLLAETVNLKTKSLEAECVAAAYHDENEFSILMKNREKLEKLKKELEHELDELMRRRERLKHLPRDLVLEYDRIQSLIEERKEHIARLKS